MNVLLVLNPPSLLFAASDGRHRPASHPVLGGPETALERPMTRSEWYHALGRNLRREREACGWSQLTLGRMLHQSSVTVCKWETGQNRPDAWTLERLEALFGRSLRP